MHKIFFFLFLFLLLGVQLISDIFVLGSSLYEADISVQLQYCIYEWLELDSICLVYRNNEEINTINYLFSSSPL